MFAGDNLIIDKRGYQICKECIRESNKKRYAVGKSVLAINNWASKNPDKVKAHVLLKRALLKGEVIKLPCEVCKEDKVDGHHPDYKKPLEVIWLCRTHHKRLHHISQQEIVKLLK